MFDSLRPSSPSHPRSSFIRIQDMCCRNLFLLAPSQFFISMYLKRQGQNFVKNKLCERFGKVTSGDLYLAVAVALWKGGALTNGLPFYQHTNWPREMSFLSSQGYQAFMANLLIGQGHTGSSFCYFFFNSCHFAALLPPKCSFGMKTCQIHINQSSRLLKTPCCVQTSKTEIFSIFKKELGLFETYRIQIWRLK